MMYSTPADMTKWMSFLSGNGPDSVLEPSTLMEMKNTGFLQPDGAKCLLTNNRFHEVAHVVGVVDLEENLN